MGYPKGTTPESGQMEMILSCRDLLEKELRPKWTYRMFDLKRSGSDTGISVSGTSLSLDGKDIEAHLSGCEKCVLFCATASAKADELIRKKEAEDIALGFMTDCLASAAVEAICDKLEEELRDRIKGMYTTWRFSPGYGDFPLELQPRILDVLDAQKRIGVTCTENLLLIPSKSVTAVIGVSDKPIEKKRMGCAYCSLQGKCDFRKAGGHCGL